MEILTVAEVASLLKMSEPQVYETTTARTRTGAMRERPIPLFKINSNVRFRNSDVEAWIERLVNHVER